MSVTRWHHEATGVHRTGAYLAQHHSENDTQDSATPLRLVRDIALLDSDSLLSDLHCAAATLIPRCVVSAESSHEWPRGVISALPITLPAVVGQYGLGSQPGSEEEPATLGGGQRQDGENPRQTSSRASEPAHQWLESPSAKQ